MLILIYLHNYKKNLTSSERKKGVVREIDRAGDREKDRFKKQSIHKITNLALLSLLAPLMFCSKKQLCLIYYSFFESEVALLISTNFSLTVTKS